MNNTHLHKQNTNSYKINFEDERVDGADKVTGKAKYTAEYNLPNMAYGVFVTSSIAKGTIKNIDTAKALASPGVLDVIYYANCPTVPGYLTNAAERPKNVLSGVGIKYCMIIKCAFLVNPLHSLWRIV